MEYFPATVKYYSKGLLCLLIWLMAASAVCHAQHLLVPGDKLVAMSELKSGSADMDYFAVNGGNAVEIGTFSFTVQSRNKTVSIYTRLQFLNAADVWIDTCVADGNTFAPIYRSSFSRDIEYILNYSKEVNGYYLDRKTQKRSIIKEPAAAAFFDSYSYPYFLGLLPLSAGYKTDVQVYDYKPGNKTNIMKTRIEEVKSASFTSSFSGQHKVWQLGIFEESTGDRYDYYIDKDTRQLWKIDILAKGQKFVLLLKESGANQLSGKFNKDETLKLIKDGSAVIAGQVFARDNHNDGALKGMAIVNINKKQYAKTGTAVILIPYTAFFKEWIKLNEACRRTGKGIPLPKEAADCIKVAPVHDTEGHFEFVNLMPGEYLMYTEFGYVHTGVQTEVTGYTDTYINGMFQGSRANTTSNGYSTNTSAAIKKIVTIERPGEKLTVKLKKTL